MKPNAPLKFKLALRVLHGKRWKSPYAPYDEQIQLGKEGGKTKGVSKGRDSGNDPHKGGGLETKNSARRPRTGFEIIHIPLDNAPANAIF